MHPLVYGVVARLAGHDGAVVGGGDGEHQLAGRLPAAEHALGDLLGGGGQLLPVVPPGDRRRRVAARRLAGQAHVAAGRGALGDDGDLDGRGREGDADPDALGQRRRPGGHVGRQAAELLPVVCRPGHEVDLGAGVVVLGGVARLDLPVADEPLERGERVAGERGAGGALEAPGDQLVAGCDAENARRAGGVY